MGPLKLVPLGYQQITLSAATGLTVPAGANVAVISVETAGLRWRDDGTNPTSSIGMPIASGAVPFEYWGDLSTFVMIAQTGTPLVDVSYYRIGG